MSGCISCGAPTPNRECRECRLMERAEEADRADQRNHEDGDDQDDDGDAAPPLVTDGAGESFNGRSRELLADIDHVSESVYCTKCGTIFVPAGPARQCPSCANAEKLADIEERLDEIEEAVDVKLDEIGRQLDQIESTTSVLADVADREDGDSE